MNLLIIPAQLEGYRSLKDRTLKLSFETGEPKPEDMARIQQSLMTAGYLAFSPEPFSKQQIDDLTRLEAEYDDPTKSPSKRLRNYFFVWFKKLTEVNGTAEGFDDFEAFYRHYMEKFMRHVADKINALDE